MFHLFMASKLSIKHSTEVGIDILIFMWKRLALTLLCKTIFCGGNCEHVLLLFDCFSFASRYFLFCCCLVVFLLHPNIVLLLFDGFLLHPNIVLLLFDCFSFASKYCRRTMEVGKQRMQFRFLQLPSYLNSLAKLHQSINCRWELCSRFLKFRKYIRQYKYAGVTSRKYGQDYNRKCNEMQLPGTCYGMLANISVSHYASLIFVFLQILQLLYYVLVRAFRLCVFLENS